MKIIFHNFLQIISKYLLVLIIDQSVLENPLTLVSPQLDKIFISFAANVIGPPNPIKDFRNIS
jgi:hypothetical protein